jgi:hypothetical protein
MYYYRDMISAVLDSLPGNKERKVMAVSRQFAYSEDEEYSDAPVIRDNLLPETVEHRRFSSADTLMDGLASREHTAGVDVLVVAPPLYVARDSDWNPAFRRHGIVRLLLDRFMGPDLGCQPADQTELFPTSHDKKFERVRQCPDMQPTGKCLDALIMLLPQRSLQMWSDKSLHASESRWLDRLDLTFVEHAHDGVHEQLAMPEQLPNPFVTLIVRQGTGTIRFMKITDEIRDCCSELIGKDLRRLLTLESGKSEFGYVRTPDPDMTRAHLSFDAASEETANLIKSIDPHGNAGTLGMIADIVWRQHFSPNADNVQPEVSAYLGRIRTQADHVLELNEETLHDAAARGGHRRLPILQDGDICLRSQLGAGGMFRFGIYQSDGRKLGVTPFVIVIRLRQEIPTAARIALLAYLNSYTAYRLAKAKGIVLDAERRGWRTINISRLMEWPVPLGV